MIDYLSIDGFNQNLEKNNFQKSKRIYTQIIGGFATVGFSDWKKGEEKIKRHENSQHHKLCVMNITERKEVLNRFDQKLKYQVETEINYWKNILTRVVGVVKPLSSREMSFRGEDDRFGSVHNGNFMISIEFIAQFDPFLAQHIENFGNKGKGSISYLSFNTYKQIISIMADNVIQQMVKEIKKAKFFSISIDSTPNISHVDQLSFIFRVLPNSGHKSEELEDAVFLVLESNGLDINNCCG
ncbi:zinc finger MYM-type protein 1-like [Hydra vulgaris]|uniref:Zinc finger MYM-type protein 1-like n=1 Tax=Hydra vulgaris TaxID=6087 RepID=A0ABM4BUD3_HYDVU